MTKKLNKEQLKSKKKFHEKKVRYYEGKIKAANKIEKRIGFKWYD